MAKIGKQTQWVKEQLVKGHKITALRAFRECGSMRLASIIHRLSTQGWEINSQLIQKIDGTRYSIYNLISQPKNNKEHS
jgi:hypothetical protein